jgi:cell division protein FtsB
MIQSLGPRGRLATATTAALAAGAAVYASFIGHWADAVTLALLGYISIVLSGLWGSTQIILRTAASLAGDQAEQGKQLRRQRRAIMRQLSRTATSSAVGSSPPSQPTTVVEAQYSGVIGQSAPVSISRLLTYLEILAKDATSRRGDDAALHQAVETLRETVQSQDEQISMLQRHLSMLGNPRPTNSPL